MELPAVPHAHSTIVRMIRYAYELNDFRRWVSGFSKTLHLPVNGGNIEINQDLGTGYIRAGRWPTGISYMVIDLSLYTDLVFTRQASPDPALCLWFDLGTGHNTLQLFSTGSQQEIIYPRNTRLKLIALLFPLSFLHRYLNAALLSDLTRYADNPTARPRDLIPFEYRQPIDDIFRANPPSPLYHLLLHNRLLLLAEKFLHSFITKIPHPEPAIKTWAKGKEKDIEGLNSVMRTLSDTQLNRFPSIEALSRMAMMSSTKLKVRFKQTYGMKLYEFYNHHRLQAAKEMLKSGNYSVKQVGVNIGFSNLSNFAKAFKKEFGTLPKEIIKSK
jgi:AraC-like DNA-binding protein